MLGRRRLPLRQKLRFVALEAEIAQLGALLDHMPVEVRRVPMDAELGREGRRIVGDVRRLLADGPPAQLDPLPASATPGHLFVAVLQSELALAALLRAFAHGRREGRIIWR